MLGQLCISPRGIDCLTPISNFNLKLFHYLDPVEQNKVLTLIFIAPLFPYGGTMGTYWAQKLLWLLYTKKNSGFDDQLAFTVNTFVAVTLSCAS